MEEAVLFFVKPLNSVSLHFLIQVLKCVCMKKFKVKLEFLSSLIHKVSPYCT